MVIEQAKTAALDDWLALRQALWPHHPEAAHKQDIDQQLSDPSRFASFLARGAEGRAFGLAEISVRTDYVNGCTSSPVAFLEGIFVQPALRGQGVARALIQAVETWAAQQGCREFASDTRLDNREAQHMHAGLGFEETERVVFYRKPLPSTLPETVKIRPKIAADDPWLAAFFESRWGGSTMAAHGLCVDLLSLPGLVAGEQAGVVTYHLTDHGAEIWSLDAARPKQGVGTALLTALVAELQTQGVSTLWVTTTNDNVAALQFYQKRGFRLQRVRPDAVVAARALKPSIPTASKDSIPICDELDLCLVL